jgi:hypothetical protein
MTTLRTHFTFRVDTWTSDGESIVEHVAGVEDYQVALATYRAACERWPGTPVTLRQGSRVIEDSRHALGVGYRCSPLPIGPLLRKHARCLIVTLFPLLSGECKPMSLDNSPEPLWLPRKVPKRVPENPVLLLFGRGSRFGEPPTDPSINSMRGDMPAARYQQVERCCNTG